MSRALFLARLARRYALRHKGQTVRALLGLLVATIVLTVGLGLGESIAGSLEDEALRRFGPIDIVVRGAGPFPAATADALARAGGVSGAATFNLVGAVVDLDTQKAEAFASIRGVAAGEREALGPLVDADGRALAEPGPGEVVLSADLAERLDARPGHVVRLRAAPPDLDPTGNVTPVPIVGTTALPEAVRPRHNLTVREGALGLGAQVEWATDAGAVTLTARSPGGIAFANSSAASPVQLLVPGPLEVGEWTLVVSSDRPLVYQGGAAVAYLPQSLEGAIVVMEARVSGVAAEEARAAITGRPSALVPLADLQRAFRQEGNATHAYYHAEGDPYAAVERMRAAIPAGEEEAINITAEKADRIAEAREAGAEITGFLLGMGGFTLLAAVLLAFTLFSALVEERRSELGIMRALGVTRGEVALAMTMEGAIYAFAAAVVGLALGLGILAVGVAMLGRVAVEAGGPAFAFHMSPSTILLSVLLGAGLPLATIAAGSFRFARLDPSRAIRGVPDDPRAGRRSGRWLALALVALGVVFCVGALAWLAGGRAGQTPVGWLVGVPIAISGLAALAWALRRPLVALALAGAAVALTLYTLYTFNDWPGDQGELDPIFTLGRAAVLALGGAALAVASAKPYDRIAAWLARGRAKRPAFVAMRYLVARRRPAGLTMAMIAIVVVIVTVMGTLFTVFSATIPGDEAGYAVLGESPLPLDAFPRPLPDDLRAAVERADFVPRHTAFRQADITVRGEPIEVEFGFRQFLGVTEGFAEGNEYQLAERAPEYATDDDAWRAAVAGEAILIPRWLAEEYDIRIGDVIGIDHPTTGLREYVLAGTVRSEFAFSPAISADHVRAMGFPVSTRVFVRIAEGADPNDAAHRLTALYAEDGATFTSIPEEVERIGAQIQGLVLVFEAFLALGLFVGLAATGFLASRAVHERMRDIGTLRALGFEESDVRRAFMIESTLTAGIGLFVGTLVGLVVAGSVWWREVRDEGAAFRPPWLLMALFATAVLSLAALASRGPAKRAAKLAPAIAVRHVE